MGVNIYILDRRPARLSVGGVEQSVGSLRRFWKITEVDDERSRELDTAEAAAGAIASPPAAMLADVYDMTLGSENNAPVKAHLVIGWDKGRTRVTDMGWDYLPTLGYGVRDRDSGTFVLHEEREGGLFPISRERAAEIGLIDPEGQMVRHGQPAIIECRSVVPFLNDYADADCTLEGGKAGKLLIGISNGELPDPSWLVGKRPMDVERYVPTRPAAGVPDANLPQPER
jgi:hypothetical protein